MGFFLDAAAHFHPTQLEMPVSDCFHIKGAKLLSNSNQLIKKKISKKNEAL